MKRINVIFFSTLICLSISSYGQKQQFNCAENLLVNQSVDKLAVLRYPEDTRVEKIASLAEAEFGTPEQLMSSVLSATSLEWLNANKEEDVTSSKQDFNYIKNIASSEYYFELKYKINFITNGVEYAVIKYLLYDDENEPISFAESFKKKNGRWFTTIESGITTLTFFLGMIDTDYLESIFLNENSNNSALNSIMFENTSNNQLNLNGVLKSLENGLNDGNEELLLILDPKRLFK